MHYIVSVPKHVPMREFLLVFVLAAAAGSSAAVDRPNIVYIMSDDHAAHAIGAYGSCCVRACAGGTLPARRFALIEGHPGSSVQWATTRRLPPWVPRRNMMNRPSRVTS